MDLFIRGKGKLNLTKKDFVSSGGEGSVYAQNNTAYKIYTNPKNMIPVEKIQELSPISQANIIKPEKVILGDQGTPVGYTMRYLKDTVSLCLLFTKAFKERNSLSRDTILNLVNKLRDGILHIHSKKILVVDLNELNFLVDQTFNDLYFIDVDSYQTKSFPARVIMENIRDRHCNNKFSELTDWFSFGIISFQLFIGVHPYKGKHEKYKGADALDKRMQNNISVFNKDVRLPPTTFPLKTIPSLYINWFKAMFENGKRVPPPFENIRASVSIITVETVTGTDNFIITEIQSFKGDILKYANINGVEIVITSSTLYINGKAEAMLTCFPSVGITQQLNHVITVTSEMMNITLGKKIPLLGAPGKFFSIDERLYELKDDTVLEIQFMETAVSTIMSTRVVAYVLPQATQIFENVLIQNLLNSYHASIFPEPNKHYQIKLVEATGYRIVDAKYHKRILMLIGEKQGIYTRFVFKIDKSFTSYSLSKIENISYTGLNFITLVNDVCANINEEGFFELFSNSLSDTRVKVIADTALADGKLFNNGTQVLLAKGNKLYSVKMK